jgi:hypothetical protein
METGSMKSLIRYSALAALLTIALDVRIHAVSTSDTKPAAPKTPVAEHVYPSILPLTLELSSDDAHELRTLRAFTITAQREGDAVVALVVGPVDPFTAENTCKIPMPAGIAGFAVIDDATIGTLRVNWQVPQAGTYRFVVTAKRGTSDGVVAIGSFDLDALD